MPSIVTVNVTQTVAPTPSQLQKQGAMISQGATTMAPGSRSILTQPSDLTALLQDLKSLASLAQVAGVATGTLKSTTIAAGVYNDETGQVTLTLTADIDVTAAEMLEALDNELNAKGIHLAFAEMRSRLQDLILRYGLLETLDRERFYPTLKAAVKAVEALGPLPPAELAPSGHGHFHHESDLHGPDDEPLI